MTSSRRQRPHSNRASTGSHPPTTPPARKNPDSTNQIPNSDLLSRLASRRSKAESMQAIAGRISGKLGSAGMYKVDIYPRLANQSRRRSVRGGLPTGGPNGRSYWDKGGLDMNVEIENISPQSPSKRGLRSSLFEMFSGSKENPRHETARAQFLGGERAYPVAYRKKNSLD
ncbi:hypothetical protein PEBR_32916 [Penicillium brasilianum]|uniref:Uncharacterized protein n=1 Tax=Penicillium brasilianum TaxID=104259 RepID=A0A1S9RFJ0_PENBI|nr:hypothetical protein PEBR_32916 [Penicillium brasilianum]